MTQQLREALEFTDAEYIREMAEHYAGALSPSHQEHHARLLRIADALCAPHPAPAPLPQQLREALAELVCRQAEDDGLWFNAKYSSEAYLQNALRAVHAAVESLVFYPDPAPAPPQARTPDASLPPLDPTTPKRTMLVTVEVPEDWERRFDMQWVLEREINADRWAWNWPAAGSGPGVEAP